MRFDKLLSFYIRSGRWDDRIGIWHDNLLYSFNLQQSTNTYQHLNIIVNVRTYNGQVWTIGNGKLIWIAIRYMEWEKRWLNSYSKHEYVSKDYRRLAGVNEQRNASIIDTITKSYRLQSTHAKASDLILTFFPMSTPRFSLPWSIVAWHRTWTCLAIALSGEWRNIKHNYIH